jgi:hypothetical protein
MSSLRLEVIFDGVADQPETVGSEEDAPTSSAIPGRLTSQPRKPPREMEGRRKRALLARDPMNDSN